MYECIGHLRGRKSLVDTFIRHFPNNVKMMNKSFVTQHSQLPGLNHNLTKFAAVERQVCSNAQVNACYCLCSCIIPPFKVHNATS